MKHIRQIKRIDWIAHSQYNRIEELIVKTYFGDNPFIGRKQSPQLGKAMEEQTKRDPILEAFIKSDEASK